MSLERSISHANRIDQIPHSTSSGECIIQLQPVVGNTMGSHGKSGSFHASVPSMLYMRVKYEWGHT